MKAIAAKSLNNVIGNKGKIPWHCVEDMKHFRSMTTSNAMNYLLCGRKTYQNMPTLWNRHLFVLTRNDKPSVFEEYRESDGAIASEEIVNSLQEIDKAYLNNLWIIGGEEIYNQFLHLCSDLFLTTIKTEVEGDAFFPEYKHLFHLDAVFTENDQLKIEHFVRINKGFDHNTKKYDNTNIN